jgi:predicted metal-dependent hydrolase
MTPYTWTHLLQGRPLRLQIRRSRRARHLRLLVSRRKGAEVVMPAWATRRDIDQLLDRSAEWLAAQVSKQDVWDGPRRPGWRNGSLLPLLGRNRRLEFQVHSTGRAGGRVLVQDDRLCMDVRPSEIHDPRPALERWMRRFAGRYLRERTADLADVVGLWPRRLMVGERTSRWGSCSARGTVSYCFRLVMARPEIIDAVVIHELCHLAHLDHGPSWKTLVERHCPDHDRHMDWLRKHSAELEL